MLSACRRTDLWPLGRPGNSIHSEGPLETSVRRLTRLTHRESSRREALAAGQVVPEAVRCIQCGICSYSCPVDIDVRAYAWRGNPVTDFRCILCGECVARCPRGTLRIRPVASLPSAK